MPSYSQIGMDPMSLLGMTSGGQAPPEEDPYGGGNPVDQMLSFLGKASAKNAQAAGSAAGAGATGTASAMDQYNNLVSATSAKYGVPSDVLRGIMWVESRGNAKAYNKTPNGKYGNATGLMQIMSGLGDGRDLYDPAVSLDIAGRMLSSHYKQYGSWDSAIQRYNGTLGKAAGQKYLGWVNAARQKYGGIGTASGSRDVGAGQTTSSGAYQSAINNALGRVGRDTYQNGARVNLNDPDPRVTDCSSLVQWSFARAGIKLPRTAFQQWGATSRIQRGQLQPGDLIFFKDTYNARGQAGNSMNISHVGIYLGNGKMVNSTGSQGRGTVVQSIDTPFWSSHLAGFGRVGQGSGMSGGAPAPVYDPFAPQARGGATGGAGATVGPTSGSYSNPFAPQASAGYKPPA